MTVIANKFINLMFAASPMTVDQLRIPSKGAKALAGGKACAKHDLGLACGQSEWDLTTIPRLHPVELSDSSSGARHRVSGRQTLHCLNT